MTAAMRSGDALRRDVLRMAQNAIYNARETRQADLLTDDELLAVLTREVKTRRESVDAFRKGGARRPRRKGGGGDRDPRRATCPHALDEAEIAALVDEAIAATGASSARDLGQGHGLARSADPRPRRRQGGQRDGRRRARPGRPRGPRTGTATERLTRGVAHAAPTRERRLVHASRCGTAGGRRGRPGRRADGDPGCRHLSADGHARRRARSPRPTSSLPARDHRRERDADGGRTRAAARAAVPPQYDFTSENGDRDRGRAAHARSIVGDVPASTRAFSPVDERRGAALADRLGAAVLECRREAVAAPLDPSRWAGRPRRGRRGPRRDRAHRAARHGRSPRRARNLGGPDGSVDLTEAERMLAAELDRAARRPERVVQRRRSPTRPATGGRGRGTGRRDDASPGRGHRPRRRADDRRGHREASRRRARRAAPRPRPASAGWFLLAVLVVARAARLDVALPARVLAPQQRPAPRRACCCSSPR